MRQNLAVKYRPKTFEEVVGQNLTTQILQQAVLKRNFKNCYLFAGDSGCGKTTLARCFANAINQGLGSPIEKDAASNNGVEDVRAIIEAAKTRAIDSEYKIFIIDECHAITTAGWQAYLKSLEDTPPYTIYIFCTTEPNKIPVTVLNRMQRYNITKISAAEIKSRLLAICQAEGFTNYEAACDLISKTSHGCMRDAIMKLGQCSDFNSDLSLANVEQILNTSYYNAMCYLTQALIQKADPEVLYTIDKLYTSGTDLKSFIEVYIEFILDLAKYAIFQDLSITNLPEYLVPHLNSIIAIIPERLWYTRLVDTLLQIKLETRYDSFYKSTIEAFLLRFCFS
jgi:DNA polymerase-3 subunit gamma/tau